MFNRKLVFTAACLGMAAFGIVLMTLGSILPSLIDRFALDKTQAGLLVSLQLAAILVGSLLMGPVADRYGFKGMLAGSCAFALLGLEGIAFAPSYAWLVPAIVLTGIAGGIINGGTNAVVADISEEGRSAGLSLLGVFFGIGAVGVPLMLAILLDRFSYSTLLGAATLTLLLPIALTVAIPFPPAKQPQGFPIRKAAALIREPLLWLLGIMLFLESGMENTVGGWTSTYFKENLGLQGQQALLVLALFPLGMTLMRLVLGTALKDVKPARLLVGCITLALVGAVLLLASTTAGPGATGVFLVGAGMAAGFPVILSFVGDRYAALTGTAFSIVLVMALTGGSLMPGMTGALGQRYGLRPSLALVPVALLLQLLLLVLVLRQLAAPPLPTTKDSAATTVPSL